MQSFRARLLVSIALASLLVLWGCDSGGSGGPSEDEAEVSLTLSNTAASSDFPGSPTQVTIRTWDTSGDNAALRTVNFPPEGETREVSLFTPPGDFFVGIMAHDDDGIVSFAAATDEPQSFSAGQTTNVNLENSLNSWDLGYSIVGGELAVDEFIVLETEEAIGEQKVNQFVEGRIAISGQKAPVFYDSQPFVQTSNAEFDAELEGHRWGPDSTRRRTANSNSPRAIQISEESLLDSMFIRVELPVDSRWGENPTSVVRPHPDSSALRLEDIASEVGITFSKEE